MFAKMPKKRDYFSYFIITTSGPGWLGSRSRIRISTCTRCWISTASSIRIALRPSPTWRPISRGTILCSSRIIRVRYRSTGATVGPQHHIIFVVMRGWKLPIVRISIGIGCWVLVFIRIRIISGKFFKGHNTFESLPLPPANVLVPFIESSVGDPWHFGTDQDPRIRTSD